MAEQYVSAFSHLAKESNTILLPSNTGDISGMVTQVLPGRAGGRGEAPVLGGDGNRRLFLHSGDEHLHHAGQAQTGGAGGGAAPGDGGAGQSDACVALTGPWKELGAAGDVCLFVPAAVKWRRGEGTASRKNLCGSFPLFVFGFLKHERTCLWTGRDFFTPDAEKVFYFNSASCLP